MRRNARTRRDGRWRWARRCVEGITSRASVSRTRSNEANLGAFLTPAGTPAANEGTGDAHALHYTRPPPATTRRSSSNASHARARRNGRWRRARRCEAGVVRSSSSLANGIECGRFDPLAATRPTTARAPNRSPVPASKVALPDATEWAFRSRTRPPSSPATTRRASANAPQRGRSAIAGGDDHAGAKRATAIAVLFGERATTRGRGATANGDERGGARRALSVRVPALWSRRRRAARRTGRALRVRTPRLRRQPRCAAHRRTPGTRALLKLKSGRTGWVEMDLAQIPGGVHLPYWSVTLPNHRAHRQIRDR
jgi:hypothetical protein